MEILGYIGFGALVLLAVVWTLGVRVKLDAGIHTIVGALFFVVAAIALGISGNDRLHSLWIIPVGFALPVVVALIGAHAPFLFGPFRLIGSTFAAVVRVGIPAHRIKAAQEAGLRAPIDEFVSRKGGGDA